jgi:hypothetical protein
MIYLDTFFDTRDIFQPDRVHSRDCTLSPSERLHADGRSMLLRIGYTLYRRISILAEVQEESAA